MGLEPGYLVSKHVKLVRMLKRGGMGSVWIADHTALQTQVAVKFMSGAAADDPAMVTRFAREATSAAQIKSPHVVQVHDHGVTAEGDPFIVMELLEGEDLSTRMRRVGQLSLDETAAILLQTSRVLGKAHQGGIIHRDIKPSNIWLVDNHGDIFIKVLDFGVAKMGSEGSELTTTGAMVGTVVYMSPEQLLSARKVDQRADLWSLAVVAYRAITGELPFKDDEGIGALCKSLEEGIFFPPSAFVPELAPEIDAWFERAFKRNPGERFADAREFAEEFFAAIGKASGVGPASAPSVALRAAHNAAAVEARSIAAPLTRVTFEGRKRAATPPATPNNAEETLSVVGAVLRPAAKRAAPSTFDDPGTFGAAPPETLAGTASGPYAAVRVRSGFRKVLIAVASLGVLGALGVAGAGFLGVLHFGPFRARVAPITGDPGVTSAAPSARPSAPPLETLPVSVGMPVPTVVPSVALKASTATSASAIASAAPPPSGSAKRSGKAGGSSRTPKPEKDYGF